MPGKPLIVGVGSHHGHDSLGWQVVERLQPYLDAMTDTRCLRSPEDLLDCLDGVRQLHVVDACDAGPALCAITVWRWPDLPCRLSTDRFSTHSADVVTTLRLAQTLGMLPERVHIWGLNVGATPFDPAVAADEPIDVDRLARRLAGQLRAVEQDTAPRTPSS